MTSHELGICVLICIVLLACLWGVVEAVRGAARRRLVRYGLGPNETYEKPTLEQYANWQPPETPYNPLYERRIAIDAAGRMTAWRYQYPCNVP